MTVFTGGGEDTDTEERPGEDTGRGWSDVATSRGAGAGGRKDPPWRFRGSSVLLAPRRGLLASRPVRGETAGVQAPQLVVICYGSPRTRSHPGGTLALLERDGGPRGL